MHVYTSLKCLINVHLIFLSANRPSYFLLRNELFDHWYKWLRETIYNAASSATVSSVSNP